jgi:hypothetical protein
MKATTNIKVRTNISVDPAVWKQFRMSCLEHDTNASAEIEAFMKARIQQWEQKREKLKK